MVRQHDSQGGGRATQVPVTNIERGFGWRCGDGGGTAVKARGDYRVVLAERDSHLGVKHGSVNLPAIVERALFQWL